MSQPQRDRRISVVVPTRNRPEALERCLHSLGCHARDAEVIVVDDGSEPPATAPPPHRVIRFPVRRGPATARNAGATAATGEVLVFLDDDCTVEPGWTNAFLDAAASYPDALLAGSIRNGRPDNWAAAFNHELVQSISIEVGRRFAPSGNLATLRRNFLAFGGFGENFPLAGGEDRDLSLRWCSSGRQIVFVEKAKATHYHPQSLSQFCSMHARYGRAARQLRREHSNVELDRRSLYTRLAQKGFLLPLLLSQLCVGAGYFVAALGQEGS